MDGRRTTSRKETSPTTASPTTPSRGFTTTHGRTRIPRDGESRCCSAPRASRLAMGQAPCGNRRCHPVEGGCANDYVYVFGDPINTSDLDGQRCAPALHTASRTVGYGDFVRSSRALINDRPREAAGLALGTYTTYGPPIAKRVRGKSLFSKGIRAIGRGAAKVFSGPVGLVATGIDAVCSIPDDAFEPQITSPGPSTRNQDGSYTSGGRTGYTNEAGIPR